MSTTALTGINVRELSLNALHDLYRKAAAALLDDDARSLKAEIERRHAADIHDLTPLPAEERWAGELTVTLQRYAFERAVRNLPRMEAWALIRAAYNCSLIEAKAIYVAVTA